MSFRIAFWNIRGFRLIAVAIIVITIISIFAVGIAVLSFQPAVTHLAFNIPFWNATTTQENSDILIFRDTMVNASYAIPIVMLGIIVVFAYLASNRRAEF